MSNPISGIRAPLSPDSITMPQLAETNGLSSLAQPSVTPPSFGRVFEQAVDRVGQLQQASRDKVDLFLQGEDTELHDVVLEAQRAELAFDYFLQVRNKVVQAYQEIMRMQM